MRLRDRSAVLVCFAGVVLTGAGRVGLAAEPTSSDLITEALAVAEKVKASGKKEILFHIASAQAWAGDVAGAKRTYESSAKVMPAETIYGFIGSTMAQAGDIEGATKLLASTDQRGGLFIYVAMAETQAKKGDIDVAMVTATKIGDTSFRNHAYLMIAVAQAKAGDVKEAKAALDKITGEESVKAIGYCLIAEARAQAGDAAACRQMIDQAKEASKPFKNYELLNVLSAIASAEVKAGNAAGAKAVLNKLAEGPGKQTVLNSIGQAQIEMGDVAGGKATVAQLADLSDRNLLDAGLVEVMAKKGDVSGARDLIKTALSLSATIPNVMTRAISSAAIVKAQAKIGDTTKAIEWARSQTDPEMRGYALIGIVEVLREKEPATRP